MNKRARNRYLLAWLPRGAMILTALLAPVIDPGEESVASEGRERVEAVGTALEEPGARES